MNFPGCTGALAREVARAFPSSSVTVFDLPKVVEMALKHFAQEDDEVTFQAGERYHTHNPAGRQRLHLLHASPEAMMSLPVAHAGDFFSDELPPADLYILGRIIHDWTEDKCVMLLRKIYEACRPGHTHTHTLWREHTRHSFRPPVPAGGGVLLVEATLFENRRGPVMAQLFSLNMLVQTQGREHPPSEYKHMLSKAGFASVQVCRTGKSYDAILAVR